MFGIVKIVHRLEKCAMYYYFCLIKNVNVIKKRVPIFLRNFKGVHVFYFSTCSHFSENLFSNF